MVDSLDETVVVPFLPTDHKTVQDFLRPSTLVQMSSVISGQGSMQPALSYGARLAAAISGQASTTANLNVTSFNPSQLNLTGWWRASFTASPWAGTASAGPSSGRDLVEAVTPPAQGAAVNGFTPADFDGLNDILTAQGLTADDLFNASSGSFGILYMVDVTLPDQGPFGDAAIVGGSGNIIAININTTGPAPHIFDTAYREVQLTAGIGAWVFVQMRWDGVNLEARVNGDSFSSTACGAAGSMTESIIFGKNTTSGLFFNGKILETFASTDVFDNTTWNNLRTYLNSRYAISI